MTQVSERRLARRGRMRVLAEGEAGTWLPAGVDQLSLMAGSGVSHVLVDAVSGGQPLLLTWDGRAVVLLDLDTYVELEELVDDLAAPDATA